MSRRRIGPLAFLCGALALPPGNPMPSLPAEPSLLARRTISLPGTHESISAFVTEDRALITRCEADFQGCRILEAAAPGGSWRIVGPAEFAPATPSAGAVPASGQRPILFHSTPAAPGAGTGADWKIWQARRSAAGWERKPLPAPVNTSGRECCVAAGGTDGAFYFSSDRDGAWEIFRAVPAASGAWTVEKLPSQINASPHGQWPSMSGPGERYLLFSSIRKGGYGGDDIYVAFREGASWTPARALPPPVNTAAYEDGARVSPDGKRLIFSSTRPQPGDESANVYEIGLGSLLTQ